MRIFNFTIRASLFLILFSSLTVLGGGGNEKSSLEKQSDLGVYTGYSEQKYKGFKYYSDYVTMPDSVKLAVDVFLPKKAKDKEKFPTIIYLTRYVRSLQAKVP